MEGPSCGTHCHAVAGARAQAPQDVTPGISTQHRVPDGSSRRCITNIHHETFCPSTHHCPGHHQH